MKNVNNELHLITVNEWTTKLLQQNFNYQLSNKCSFSLGKGAWDTSSRDGKGKLLLPF